MDKTLRNAKWEAKKRKAKELGGKAWEATKSATMWALDHKVEIAAVAGGVAVLAKTGKKVMKVHDEYISERTIYDPSLKKSRRLKKPLTTSQMNELANRHRQGEKISDILEDMNVLK